MNHFPVTPVFYTFLITIIPTLIVAQTYAADIVVDNVSASRLHKSVQSYKALREKNIVMQAYDYSCGAASLATIFANDYDDSVSEQALLKLGMQVAQSDEKTIREKGFSLLDLKKIAESRGYRTRGLRLRLQQLAELTDPVMIFYTPNGYPHFSVFKKVQGNRVYLADPIRGNIRVSSHRFLTQWQGIALVVYKDGAAPLSYALDEDRVSEPSRQQVYRQLWAWRDSR